MKIPFTVSASALFLIGCIMGEPPCEEEILEEDTGVEDAEIDICCCSLHGEFPSPINSLTLDKEGESTNEIVCLEDADCIGTYHASFTGSGCWIGFADEPVGETAFYEEGVYDSAADGGPEYSFECRASRVETDSHADSITYSLTIGQADGDTSYWRFRTWTEECSSVTPGVSPRLHRNSLLFSVLSAW